LACADAIRTFPCDQFLKGVRPDCVTPGLRQEGEECLYPSQCASLACSTDDNTCGVCVARVGEGQSCASAGPYCQPGFDCDAGKCVAATIPALKKTGEACSPNDVCVGGTCDATGMCAVPGTLGMACYFGRCYGGLVCDVQGGNVCKAPGAQGMPCVFQGSEGHGYCADGACRFDQKPEDGVCGAYFKLGETCVKMVPGRGYFSFDCEPGTVCYGPVGHEPTCIPRLDYDKPCETEYQCKAGLTCLCPASTPPGVSCAQRVCGKVGVTGDPCSSDGSPCYPAFACENGICTPRKLQGLFETACGKP
jgi:hypothetical protein